MRDNIKSFDFSYSIITYQHNEAFGIDIYSIGCELSHYDANKICEIINQKYENSIIVSTCAVVESAKKISLSLLRKLKVLYPDRQILISGCGVNYSIEEFEKYGKCFTNEQKFLLKSYEINHIGSRCFNHLSKFGCGSYVKIQDGCSSQCGYCIIPKLRSHPESMPYQEIHDDIEEIIRENNAEISLIGTEVARYYSEGMNLVQLIKKIVEDFPSLQRIWFNAIDPTQKDVVLQLIDLMRSEKRLSKTLVLSPQSCSNDVLKMMNRLNTYESLRQIMRYAHEAGIDVIWHIIVGYPGETDEMFQQTLKGIQELKPFDVSFHKYSERKGTLSESLSNKIQDDKINNRIDLAQKEMYKVHSCNMHDYKGQLDEVEIELSNGNLMQDVLSSVDINTDSQLANVIRVGHENIVVDFETIEDYREFELNTKLLHTLTKTRLFLRCSLDSNFINFCNLHKIRNLEQLGYIYSASILVKADMNVHSLSNEQFQKLIQMIRDRRKDGNAYNYIRNHIDIALDEL